MASTVMKYVGMTRTVVDLDDEACRVVMERYHLDTKSDAVNLALGKVAGEALGLDDARALRGSGWDGDLNQMRADEAMSRQPLPD